MRFEETSLRGASIIDPERLEDERGLLARAFREQEFAEQGLEARFAQCNISFNKRRGTLREMHYQVKPYEEANLVR
jgi:dTDP-4-dehydrorhamnose 3,5-epimerase